MKTGIYNALELLPEHISEAVSKIKTLDSVDEIRLRINKPVCVSVAGMNMFLQSDGSISESCSNITVIESDIEHAFKTAFSYSLHSYSKELASGYITTKGGNRVGICGTAVIPSGDVSSVDNIKYVSSINIRIAREIIGAANKLNPFCRQPCGILVIGPPASGKTTLLRDLTRTLGSFCRVSLIDEQNEISATYRNEAFCDVGNLTDVFVGYPKHIGIITAVKVMSPEVIVVDEIGTASDIKALEYAFHSGAKLVTAIHSDSYENAIRKPRIRALVNSGAFSVCAVLEPYSSSLHNYRVIKLD